jgi:hypothetical protein
MLIIAVSIPRSMTSPQKSSHTVTKKAQCASRALSNRKFGMVQDFAMVHLPSSIERRDRSELRKLLDWTLMGWAC